jgi:hypothetical protein
MWLTSHNLTSWKQSYSSAFSHSFNDSGVNRIYAGLTHKFEPIYLYF